MYRSKVPNKVLISSIREKREQLLAIRAEVQDLIDYLEALDDSARNQNNPRTGHSDVMKRYRVK